MAKSSHMAKLLATIKLNRPPEDQQAVLASSKGKAPSAAYTVKQYKVYTALIKLVQQKLDIVGFYTIVLLILNTNAGQANGVLLALSFKQQDKY
jgi:hypothetical protein